MAALRRVSGKLVSAAYRAQQLWLFLPALAAQQTMRVVVGNRVQLPAAAVNDVRRRYEALLATDLANVRAGLYPRSLLFQFPVRDHARALPALLADVPRTLRRFRSRDHRDLPPEADSARYPDYFRRNFHWQTDGYFSRRSARLYDLGVELLFLGVADVMRRQVIPPITRELARRGRRDLALLDVACGTGHTLRQIAAAHPDLSLSGVDLSRFYVDEARARLRGRKVALAVDSAEALPFADGSQAIVTCVYLLHELPRDVRRRALAEMHRVLEPGGLLILADSIQPGDAPELAPFLDRFSVDFHEPYYRGYLRDDLATACAETGFEPLEVSSHFVSKLVVARAAR